LGLLAIALRPVVKAGILDGERHPIGELLQQIALLVRKRQFRGPPGDPQRADGVATCPQRYGDQGWRTVSVPLPDSRPRLLAAASSTGSPAPVRSVTALASAKLRVSSSTTIARARAGSSRAWERCADTSASSCKWSRRVRAS